MIMLNTSNITIPVIPMVKGTGFRIEPDWIATRDEVTDGYKRFYALVVRRIGKRGSAYLSIEGLAEDLCVCTRTISNYIKTSRELNLMEITSTGRSSRFVILWHPWMPISLEQAQNISLNSSEKFSTQSSKIFLNGSPQTKKNQQVGSDLKNLETVIRQPIEELRSMHASDVPANSNFTTSENKQEEPINSDSNASSKTDRDDHKEPPKSQYDYEMCERFVIEYAKLKLATRDEIKDLRAFALYCYETGDKDPWIAEFIKNNYTLSPVNPFKDQQASQAEQAEKQQSKVKKISPKQARKAKGQATETEQIKGKHPYDVYYSYAEWCKRSGQPIESVEAIAKHCYRTGSQDKQVADYLELFVGGKLPTLEPQQAEEPSPSLAQSMAELEMAQTINSLGNQAWNSLAQQQKNIVMELASSRYKEKYPPSTTSRDRVLLEKHLLGILPFILGQLLFNSNTTDLAEFGKHLWEQLSDEDIANFFDEGIFSLEQKGVDVYAFDKQQELLSMIQVQMGWKLVVGQLMKRL